MYTMRLGEHFEMQGAQRSVVARVEEVCLQPGGKKKLMLIDKMDQNALYLRTIWPMLRSSFFREGE